MDTVTHNNHMNKSYKKQQQQPRIKSSTFSQVVLKTDVGEFQDGVFVAAEYNQPLPKNKNSYKTTERPTLERPKSESSLAGRPNHTQQREHSSVNLHNYVQPVPAPGDQQVSSVRLTSPTRSPNRRRSPNNNNNSPHSQSGYPNSANPPSLSPPKHRHEKHVERPEQGSDRGGSPPKDKSPAPSRWAGPAFSNAPPPSSLPIPDFPPFASPTSSPSSSPPPAPVPTQSVHPPAPIISPVPVLPQALYREPYFYSHPVYYAQLPPHPAYFSGYGYAPSSTVEDQISMDLRRMLHIEQPVPPILA